MEVDLNRPPVKLVRVWPHWVTIGVTVGLLTVGLIIVFAVLLGPSPWGIEFLLAAVGLFLLAMTYWMERRVTPPLAFLTRGRPEDASQWYNPVERRAADPFERAAYKRWRTGEITRVQFEQIVAVRRFAHGELTRSQYEQLRQQLRDAAARPSA
jgi:hypothetical protein